MLTVHFGAGSIGRGFIADVLHKNEFEIVFVDVNDSVINQINRTKSYQVQLIDEKKTSFTINNVSALNSKTQEAEILEKIREADVITTSVGVDNLERIAPILTKGLYQRVKTGRKIDIIANENAVNATNILKEQIQKLTKEKEFELINENTGFVNSAIDRLALSSETTDEVIPMVEPYFEWIVERPAFKNPKMKEIEGMTYVDDIIPYVERKLYIVNAGHAATAYLGYLMNEESVQSTLANEKPYNFVKKLMRENSKYLVKHYNMNQVELDSFIDNTMQRFSNPMINDDVKRVGSSPIRKLGNKERLVGPLLKLHDLNLPIDYGEKIIAVALCFNEYSDEEAVELADSIKNHGIVETLKKYADMQKNEIRKNIEKIYEEIELNPNSIFKEE